jgi:hypothetical protein
MLKRLILAICVAVLMATSAVDADILYTGADDGAEPGSTLTNSDAAAALFDADAGSIGTLQLVDFESLSTGFFTALEIAPGVTATMSDVQNAAGCGITTYSDRYLGFNTTSGGEQSLRVVPALNGGTTTLAFTFDVPIQAWGAYITGLEASVNGDLFVVYDDGSVHEYEVTGTTVGGAQFFGFTDVGMSISTVTLELRNVGSNGRDWFAVDDMRYTPIPEPATMLMLGGLGAGLAGARKLRRKK